MSSSGSGRRSLSHNQWVTGSNLHSVHFGCCVLVLVVIRQALTFSSLASVRVPQSSCGNNVAYRHQHVNVWTTKCSVKTFVGLWLKKKNYTNAGNLRFTLWRPAIASAAKHPHSMMLTLPVLQGWDGVLRLASFPFFILQIHFSCITSTVNVTKNQGICPWVHFQVIIQLFMFPFE